MAGACRVRFWIAILQFAIAGSTAMADDNPLETQQVAPASQDGTVSTPSLFTEDDAVLETILLGWEHACSKITRLDAEFKRFRYDLTFETEHRSHGRLAVDTQQRAAYRVVPESLKQGDVSRRLNSSGQPFTVREETPERWHWIGKSVIQVDEISRTFEELTRTTAHSPSDSESPNEIEWFGSSDEHSTSGQDTSNDSPQKSPEDESSPKAPSRGIPPSPLEIVGGIAAGIVLTAVVAIAFSQADVAWAVPIVPTEFWIARPFLLGVPREELKKQFQIELAKQSESDVWLKFIPRNDCRYYSNACLILDRRTFTPKALKLATGNCETVHVFSNVRVNATTDNMFIPIERLDAPRLKGYKRRPSFHGN